MGLKFDEGKPISEISFDGAQEFTSWLKYIARLPKAEELWEMRPVYENVWKDINRAATTLLEKYQHLGETYRAKVPVTTRKVTNNDVIVMYDGWVPKVCSRQEWEDKFSGPLSNDFQACKPKQTIRALRVDAALAATLRNDKSLIAVRREDSHVVYWKEWDLLTEEGQFYEEKDFRKLYISAAEIAENFSS